MKTHLIQSLELFGPPERQEELKQVHAINEGLFDAHTDYTGRPTFTEMLALVIPEYVTIISNADISFTKEAIELMTQVPEKTIYCLSRWEKNPDGTETLWAHADSADTWCFRGYPPLVDIPWPLGVPGVDCRIPHAFEEAGWSVLNPSRTIRTLHHHSVAWRSYYEDPSAPPRSTRVIERVPPPYRMVHPCEL